MTNNTVEETNEIIGDAHRFGCVHDCQLVFIKPGYVQQHISAFAGERRTGHRTVIADRRIMDDITIMQDRRRDRHHSRVTEFAS